MTSLALRVRPQRRGVANISPPSPSLFLCPSPLSPSQRHMMQPAAVSVV